jgi:hypothetical protein
VRASDLVARLGGDEFIVVLTATDLDGARHVAENMAAATLKTRLLGFNWQITASFGIATFPDHGPDIETVMAPTERSTKPNETDATASASPPPSHEQPPQPGKPNRRARSRHATQHGTQTTSTVSPRGPSEPDRFPGELTAQGTELPDNLMAVRLPGHDCCSTANRGAIWLTQLMC